MASIGTCRRLIAADVSSNCENPVTMGYEAIGYLLNKTDIASVTRTGNVISAIELKPTAKAYHIFTRGKKPYNGTNKELVEGDVLNSWKKTLTFRYMNDGAAACDVVDTFNNGEFVAIIEGKWDNAEGDASFEVLGFEGGLVLSSPTTFDKNANDGGWVITMIESDAQRAGIFFNAGTRETSRTALESYTQGA